MTTKPLTRTRLRLAGLRLDIAEQTRNHTDYLEQSAVALMATVDAVLALHQLTCEVNGTGAACGESCTMALCSSCGEDWPCHTRQTITNHTRNLP